MAERQDAHLSIYEHLLELVVGEEADSSLERVPSNERTNAGIEPLHTVSRKRRFRDLDQARGLPVDLGCEL